MFVSIEAQKKSWEKVREGVYKIGVVVTHSHSQFANQLIQYIEDLNTYSTVDCVGVVLDDDASLYRVWFDDNFNKTPFVCCTREECGQLTLLDAIILLGSDNTIYDYIPSSIIKIGLPHGSDVPIETTLCIFGGGFYFDYILSARAEPKLVENKYIDNFPVVMRLHEKPFVCDLPFGFPKLDKFLSVVTKNNKTKKAIVYHLSLLSIEESWVGDAILGTLQTLLNEFPEYKIIFRVHHLNRDDPKVVKSVELGLTYENFHYSDADSYIEDYADGAVMVTHREYYNHLFDLATGSPTVLYKMDDDYDVMHEHDQRYFIANEANFLQCLNQALSAKFDTSVESRKKRCIEAGIFNPGGSLDYLVNNLKHIVNGEILPQSTPYYLNDGSLTEVDFKLRQFIVSNVGFGTFSMAYCRLKNNSPTSLLLQAESFIRYDVLKEYFYPFGLKCFYQLLQCSDFDVISFEIEYWWLLKGRFALDFCFEAIEKDKIPVPPELLWLKEHYQVSVESIKKINSLISNEFNIISLYDGSYIKSNDVILYGTGEFSERILSWNKKEKIFNPIVLVDGNKSKQGTIFCGLPVVAPTELYKYKQDIIICSKGSLSEITHSLMSTKVKNKLFTFVDQPMNNLLLNLLTKEN